MQNTSLRGSGLASERGLALRIADDKIIDAMTSVPDDVQKILRELQRMSNIRATRRTRRLRAAGIETYSLYVSRLRFRQ